MTSQVSPYASTRSHPSTLISSQLTPSTHLMADRVRNRILRVLPSGLPAVTAYTARVVPLWLILHSAQCDDTDAQDAAHLFKPGKTPPYNIVFERARGRQTATILLPAGLAAAHCPGYNATSIGAAWFADLRKRALSADELAFAGAILRPWCERWGIRPGHVLPHRTLRPGLTDCPGRYYDHAAVLAAIFEP